MTLFFSGKTYCFSMLESILTLFNMPRSMPDC